MDIKELARRYEQQSGVAEKHRPAMQQWVAARDAQKALEPAAHAWYAARVERKRIWPELWAAADLPVCKLAYDMRDIPEWRPEDLVPPRAGGGLYDGLLAMVIILPLALVGGTVAGILKHGWSGWWLLLTLPLAAFLARVAYYHATWTVRLRQYAAEEKRTHGLYHRARLLQWALGLANIQSVTPDLARALAGKYPALKAAADAQAARVKEANRAAAAARRSTAATACGSAAGGAVYADDTGGFDSASSAASSSSWRDDPAPDYTPSYSVDYGAVNPANGMPMIPGSPLDVTGHVYGTDW